MVAGKLFNRISEVEIEVGPGSRSHLLVGRKRLLE